MRTEITCAKCFKALGVPSRLKIYKFLAQKDRASVSEIVGIAQLTQPTVSYHLREMEKSGLVLSIKKGKQVFYLIDPRCHARNETCFLAQTKLLKEKENA